MFLREQLFMENIKVWVSVMHGKSCTVPNSVKVCVCVCVFGLVAHSAAC